MGLPSLVEGGDGGSGNKIPHAYAASVDVQHVLPTFNGESDKSRTASVVPIYGGEGNGGGGNMLSHVYGASADVVHVLSRNCDGGDEAGITSRSALLEAVSSMTSIISDHALKKL